jgi:choline dehydrogenase-like flavoprotein
VSRWTRSSTGWCSKAIGQSACEGRASRPGPADTLRSAGVDVAVDSPNVGARLREHRAFMLQFRLTEELGYNTSLNNGAAAAEYEASRSVPMATPSFDIVGFFKTRPEHDRTAAVGVFRGLRRLFATGPLATQIAHETIPGDAVQTDREIIDAGLLTGGCGYHTVATCAMGPNDDDVVDHRLRVRGVTNLRVVDASVLPTMVSGNLNGPVSALAWRAADLIQVTSARTRPGRLRRR